MSSLPLAAMGAGAGFTRDLRFAGGAIPLPPEDPLTIAWAEGYAAGLSEATASAEARAVEEAQARSRFEFSFARLDETMAEALRLRLAETVAALCEAALTPLAHDPDAMAGRIDTAARMLARADDERVLRLHPDDLVLLEGQLPADWPVLPDPALERGALRVESTNGGVEDGPGQWRRAIEEALGLC